jgi:Uma2 family endonuclease
MTTTAVPAQTFKPTRRRFTVEEFYAMAEAGILAPDERVELLNGEVVAMSPIGDVHAYSVDEAVYLFTIQLGERARVRSQNPVRLASNREFQPDVSILRWREDKYLSGHPVPEDVLLLMEVSDSTLDYDRNVKLAIYAEAEIPETWIANIPDQVVEVYTLPSDGVYQMRRVFSVGESVSPLAFPDVSLPVSRIVPG